MKLLGPAEIHDLAERLRMALAEAGYPDVYVDEDADGAPAVFTYAVAEPYVPSEVFHRALVVVGAPVPACYECWNWTSHCEVHG